MCVVSCLYLVARFPVCYAVSLVQRHKCYFVAPAFYSDVYQLSQGETGQGFGSRIVPVA
jgi:hypothetical protein